MKFYIYFDITTPQKHLMELLLRLCKVMEDFGRLLKVLEGFGSFWKVLKGFGSFWMVLGASESESEPSKFASEASESALEASVISI